MKILKKFIALLLMLALMGGAVCNIIYAVMYADLVPIVAAILTSIGVIPTIIKVAKYLIYG